MKKTSQLIRVENYINPMSQDIWWYYIPGFNGYEISNTGIVRSMKHYKKYPYGILIRPKEVSDPFELFIKSFPELTYELSDNNNERKIIKRSELQYLANNNSNKVQGYPRRTIVTDISPRNMRCFIKKKNTTPLTEQIHQVQFYYEKDTDVKNGELINDLQSPIIKPLIFERTENNV